MRTLPPPRLKLQDLRRIGLEGAWRHRPGRAAIGPAILVARLVTRTMDQATIFAEGLLVTTQSTATS